MPSEAEYQTAWETLEKNNWTVDYIISHCCPAPIQDEISGGMYQRTPMTDFFEEVARRTQFKYWFFGHLHDNVVVRERYVLLYEKMIRLKI